MINKVILIGHLGSDPETRHLEGGTAVARISVATTESYKDKAGEWVNLTDWHNVILWRDLAERAEKYLKKGSKVYVEGKISYRKYTKDGVERTVTDIVASTFRSLDKKEAGDTSTSTDTAKFPDTTQEPASSSMDDLPF